MSKKKILDWNEDGINYLLQVWLRDMNDNQLAKLYDEDHDGILSTEDLHLLFAPLPDSLPLWESCSSLLYSFYHSLIQQLNTCFP